MMKVPVADGPHSTRNCDKCTSEMSIVLGKWACPICNHSTDADAQQLYHTAKRMGYELATYAGHATQALDQRRVAEILINLNQIHRTLAKNPCETHQSYASSISGIIEGWTDHFKIGRNRRYVINQLRLAEQSREKPDYCVASRWYWRIMLPALRQKIEILNFYRNRSRFNYDEALNAI